MCHKKRYRASQKPEAIILARASCTRHSLQGLSPQIPVKGAFGLLPGRILVADGRPEAKGVLRVRALDRQTGRLIDSFQPPDLPRNDPFVPGGNGFCVLDARAVRCYNPSSGLFRPVARTRGRISGLGTLPIGSTLYLDGFFGKHRRSLEAVDLRTGRARAFAPRLRLPLSNHNTTLLAASHNRLYIATRAGLLLALSRRTGRIVRRYPNAGNVCNSDCGLSLASGRLWTFNGSVLRVLSTRTGEILARLDLHAPIVTIEAIHSRVYVGGSFGDPDKVTRSNAPRPFLTAFDLLG